MKTKSICIGTGLVALDVILNGKPETPAKFFAGGSCGNVITILSYLGWDTYPVARLANNTATKEIENDLKLWNVHTSLLTKTIDGRTPIIIHRILKDKEGNPKHRFEFRDPDSGKWLPSYKPVLNKELENITDKQPKKVNVFYFDRINRGAIELAKKNKEFGAVVFFEPSSIGQNLKQFQECLEVADVIKFSSERIPNYHELFPIQQVPLEIETLGSKGLRYRFSLSKKAKNWHNINSFKITHLVDSAGAGDWCSAGIINKIALSGIESFQSLDKIKLKSALNYGQALGALNCYFEGARGLMYEISEKSKIPLLIRNVIEEGKTFPKFKNTQKPNSKDHLKVSSLLN